MNKVWEYEHISEEAIRRLVKDTGITPFLAKVFLARGICDPQFIQGFLNPTLEELWDPFLLNDMETAVGRILLAIKNNEKVTIYGDYDVDGVTSTSILYTFLKSQKVDVDYYIPDRIEDGYGLSIHAIDKVLQRKVQLLITVDCGIVAVDEVEYCRRKQVDVIITDHHECTEALPAACAVVSPSRKDNRYPFRELAGVGVVFKLVQALCMQLKLGNTFYDYLELAAMGTVADVVPLVGENRILVRHGLERMGQSANLGLDILMETCGQKDKPITSWSIAFVLAPRINAAGRMGDASRGVRLFTTQSTQEALALAKQLNEENKLRQEQEAVIIEEALAIIASDKAFEKEKVLVLAKEGWHHGIIGIVASKMVDRYYKPCILISTENGIGKGSGRSIEGLDLFESLQECGGLLEKYGGHALAAGLSVKTENIPSFRKSINEIAETLLEKKKMVPKLKIDTVLGKDDICLENILDLDKLAPFGAGNPLPVFEYDGLKISDIRTVGDSKHLKLRLDDQRLSLDAIGFHFGSWANELNKGDILDIACALEINTWNSVQRVQLNLRDLRPVEFDIKEEAFYYSLDRCLDLTKSLGEESTKDLNQPIPLSTIEGLEAMLFERVQLGKTPFLLTNTLEALKSLEKLFLNSSQNIKNRIKICYTSFNGVETDKIYVLVNPLAEDLHPTVMDPVIFFGHWLDETYFHSLLQKMGKQKTYIFSEIEDVNRALVDALIPERPDMAAVYRYIRSNSHQYSLTEKTGEWIKKLTQNQRLNLNYFKMKKILEIFQELDLININCISRKDIMLTLPKNEPEKRNMEQSSLFITLQNLKSNWVNSKG